MPLVKLEAEPPEKAFPGWSLGTREGWSLRTRKK